MACSKKVSLSKKRHIFCFFLFFIYINLFTQPFVSASLTHLNPSNSLWSNYQTHRSHIIKITVTFFLLILKTCLRNKNCLYIQREKKYSIKRSINELVQVSDLIINFYLDHTVYYCLPCTIKLLNLTSSELGVSRFIVWPSQVGYALANGSTK